MLSTTVIMSNIPRLPVSPLSELLSRSSCYRGRSSGAYVPFTKRCRVAINVSTIRQLLLTPMQSQTSVTHSHTKILNNASHGADDARCQSMWARSETSHFISPLHFSHYDVHKNMQPGTVGFGAQLWQFWLVSEEQSASSTRHIASANWHQQPSILIAITASGWNCS